MKLMLLVRFFPTSLSRYFFSFISLYCISSRPFFFLSVETRFLKSFEIRFPLIIFKINFMIVSKLKSADHARLSIFVSAHPNSTVPCKEISVSFNSG